jgi:hypothetical protein
MSAPNRPEKYWHCWVQLLGQQKRSVENDLSFQELQDRIVTPWHRNVPFPVAGKVVTGRDSIQEIRIAYTPNPKEYYANEHDRHCSANGVADWATDRRLLPLTKGKDFTHELLFANLTTLEPELEIGLILKLCARLPNAARILASRRAKKKPFAITDEYDVQDLLHAVLRAYLKYSVQEEPLSKIGGVRSSRADVAIEELGTIVEVKYVRGPADQQRLIDEYSNDLLLYTAWPHLKHLIFLVYNSQDLRDPEALDKLGGPQEINGVSFTSYIVRA